ncbi:helix-turn-helix domain-containing protein [Chryseobacterium sp. PS-8]|uniref:Helix-turn-helix domain-containing protein n=1 Tax=Chryseobacterium indicum TaxID=2766954 RepID=A0ABS9C922_9FLAO|nr:helix-turn-helix domain-containing protein [Chryseobacterium sp. PS-8]MCF2220674.1 helix-turn-helix domain-containing protein [Chryseobacterium sp. PS-8]
MYKILFILIFSLCQNLFFSQSIEEFHIKDSIKATTYAKNLILNGKKNSNNVKLINGYLILSRFSNENKIIPYLDSVLIVAKEINNREYLSDGYTYKGNHYYLKGDYLKSLDNYLLAKNFCEENSKNYNIINFNIGLLKLELENYDEAINLFLNYKSFLEQNKLTEKSNYVRCLYALAYAYNKRKDIKTSNLYLNLGFQKNDKVKNAKMHSNLLLIAGINEYNQKDYKKSLQTLAKVSGLIKTNSFDPQNLALSEYYSGKCLIKLNNSNFLKKFEIIDSIIIKTKDITPELRDTYPILIDYYKKLQNKDKQLYYIERLLAVDNILYKKKSILSNQINKKYDTPILLKEKEKLISDLNSKNHILFWLLGIGSIFLAIALFLYLSNIKKVKLYKEKADSLLSNSKPSIVNNTDENFNSPTLEVVDNKIEKSKVKLSDDKFLQLSLKLEEFEKGKRFLDKNMNLDILSKELNTNRAYLSRSVNELKGKNFSQYLNELRINYIIEELKTNTQLQKFTIASIAEHAGYNNSVSFTTSFRKITGTLPSYFIKALNEI